MLASPCSSTRMSKFALTMMYIGTKWRCWWSTLALYPHCFTTLWISLFFSPTMYLTFLMSVSQPRALLDSLHAISRRSRGLLFFNCYSSPCHFLCFILFLHSSLNVPSVPFFLFQMRASPALRRLGVPNRDILEIHSNLFCLQCLKGFTVYIVDICCVVPALQSVQSSKYRSGPMGTPYMAPGLTPL